MTQAQLNTALSQIQAQLNSQERSLNNIQTTPASSPSIRDIMNSQVRNTNATFTIRTIGHTPSSNNLAPIDSGADTTLMGRNFHIVETYTHRTVDIIGYDTSMKPARN